MADPSNNTLVAGAGSDKLGGKPFPAIPKYEIEGVLGRGGMGMVYKARQTGLNRFVALKMIRPSPSTGEQESARFQVEAKAVARLNHPNIVQIYDIGVHDGCPYFSMELVAGGNLQEVVGGKLQPISWAAELLEKLARTIDFAHKHGVIHRDLKPANVLLTPEGEPKVADFGLAKSLEGTPGLTLSGVIMGTPLYMAPEQASGKVGDVGPAADVYSLGAMLYELLVGHPPFRGETPQEIMDAHRLESPGLPAWERADVPDGLQRICLKALEKQPRDRYPSAGAMADDLKKFLAGEIITTRPSIFDNVLSSRIQKHMDEISSWHRERLLSVSEYARLMRVYRPFARRGLAAFVEPRALSFRLLILYFGGWLLINGADLWLAFLWSVSDDWLSRLSRVVIGSFPLVLSAALGGYLWKKEHFRAAFVMMTLAIIAFPSATGIILRETRWCNFSFGETPGLFGGGLLNVFPLAYSQWLIVFTLALAASSLAAFMTRTVTLSSLALLFAFLLYTAGVDYANLPDLPVATTALRYLPFLLGAVGIGWVLAKVLDRADQSIPWFIAALASFLVITQVIALFAPSQWKFITSSIQSSSHQQQLAYALEVLCGLTYLSLGSVIRFRMPVEGREAAASLLILGPLCYLGAFLTMTLTWPEDWLQVPLFGGSIPLPLWGLLALAVLTTLASSRKKMRIHSLIGLMFTAVAIWLVGQKYLPDVGQWPLLLLFLGFIITAITFSAERRRPTTETDRALEKELRNPSNMQ